MAGPHPPCFRPVLRYHAKLPAASQCCQLYLLDMAKDYITRTRASIKGAVLNTVLKARDTAGRDLVV